ncbi:hypothetical protein OG604_14875 [Streptomyces sp. NBC_01231]|nr:hypothetical protein OG604_14875 [Streptomyces sp. NBC_01231]
MSNEVAPMAPMPVHRNTDDPLWRTLWNAYEPVITALRRIPLVTNVESGNMFAITAELTDGSYLWITSAEDLPIDLGALEGFHVKRLHDDTPTIDELVYDSTDGGEQSEHGNNVVPLIQAITAFVTERRLAPRVIDLVSGPCPGRADDRLMTGTEAVPSNAAEETGMGRCACIIAHPQDDDERARVRAALDNALATNDAHAVFVVCMQLLSPCPARYEAVAR